MHLALELENIEKLPPDLLKLATALIAPDPSPRDVSLFTGLATEQRFNNSETLLALLPVFYRLLDPARIPKPEELDSLTKDVLRNITLAHSALWGLFTFRAPPECGTDLWPHIWPWVHFYFTYEDFLSGVIDLNPSNTFYSGFMLLCADLVKDPESKAVMFTTPRIPVLAVRAWTTFTKPEDCSAHDGRIFRMIHDFIHQSKSALSLDELMDGTSGGFPELARLVMLACDLFLFPTTKDPALHMKNVAVFNDALKIVLYIDWNKISRPPSSRLCDALTSLGFVKSLIIIGRELCAHAHNEIRLAEFLGIIVRNCLYLVEPLCQGVYGPRVLRTAIQHGLLHIIVAGATWPAYIEEDTAEVVHDIISHLLIPCTVFYYLLPELDKAHKEVQNFVHLTVWSNSELAEAWGNFSKALQARLHYRDRYRSVTRVKGRECCANIECGSTEGRRFWWCSGCHSVSYCSKACQSIHWRLSHRAYCSRAYMFRRSNIPILTNREYGFLHFIRYHDGHKMKREIYRQQVLSFANNPNTALRAVLLNYKEFPVTVELFDVPKRAQHSPSVN
ncbi:hypothetical protein R3P38DRAFT_619227 [Favolaschia claudopus]|uniref:MYND-type domain-containing protein n=1 Tax=Favolaschia claudopus TaxID=2862362 RepID=A0AAW0CF11_9AGAR